MLVFNKIATKEYVRVDAGRRTLATNIDEMAMEGWTRYSVKLQPLKDNRLRISHKLYFNNLQTYIFFNFYFVSLYLLTSHLKVIHKYWVFFPNFNICSLLLPKVRIHIFIRHVILYLIDSKYDYKLIPYMDATNRDFMT